MSHISRSYTNMPELIETGEKGIHMTGAMTNPMNGDLRLLQNHWCSICLCLTLVIVSFIGLLMLYIQDHMK